MGRGWRPDKIANSVMWLLDERTLLQTEPVFPYQAVFKSSWIL